jgi:hypothetical protein
VARFDDRFDDYDEEPRPDVSMSTREQQEYLYGLFGFIDAPQDQHARDLFWDAYYNDELDMPTRMSIQDELADYLWNEYDIDYFVVWDWDDFREWYAAQ